MSRADTEGRPRQPAGGARVTASAVTGVVLAGGRGRRMGGSDKGLIEFAGRPLVRWVIEALAPQVGSLLISANRNRERYARYGADVVTDADTDYKGPLAGMLSAMRAARTAWVLTVPCDGPFLPDDLLARLAEAMTAGGAEMAVATGGGRIQPVYSLQPVTFAAELGDFIAEGNHQVARWVTVHRYATADFTHHPKCFANINSREDLERLARGLRLPPC